MQPHHLKHLLVGVLLCLAFVLGMALQSFVPFARTTAAQSIVVDGHVTPADPAAPAAPAGIYARLTYQGRLTNSSGAPLNSTVNIVFRLYNNMGGLLWTSSPTRTVTPVNGLFTVYLGDGADPNLYSDFLIPAASIGVTVGSDAEMTPRQALNTVVGHSQNDAGVVGSSASNVGVVGSSDSSIGVYGSSSTYDGVYGFSTSGRGVGGSSTSNFGVQGTSNSWIGVSGISNSSMGVGGSSNTFIGVQSSSNTNFGVRGSTGVITGAGVVAYNAVVAGPALQIEQGGIKVIGAGVGTNTPTFIHQAAGGATFTCIDHPLLNGNANAILIVTPRAYWNGAMIVSSDHAIGVYYDVTGFSCPANRWQIYDLDGSNMTGNARFDVLVITP